VHAQGLAEWLRAAGVERLWPLPIDAASGELWQEVDRFAEARDAFRRAVPGTGGRVALGLARAFRRLEQAADACAAYHGAVRAGLGSAGEQEARDAIARLSCPEP